MSSEDELLVTEILEEALKEGLRARGASKDMVEGVSVRYDQSEYRDGDTWYEVTGEVPVMRDDQSEAEAAAGVNLPAEVFEERFVGTVAMRTEEDEHGYDGKRVVAVAFEPAEGVPLPRVRFEDFETMCDHCGAMVLKGEVVPFEAVPVDVASANAGESATLCEKCAHFVKHASSQV